MRARISPSTRTLLQLLGAVCVLSVVATVLNGRAGYKLTLPILADAPGHDAPDPVSACPVPSVADIARIAPVFQNASMVVRGDSIRALSNLRFHYDPQRLRRHSGVPTGEMDRHGKVLFVLVRVANGSLAVEGQEDSVWPRRVDMMLQSLRVAVETRSVPETLSATFLLHPHDSCYGSSSAAPGTPGYVDVPIFSFSATSNCATTIPFPGFPEDHNPFFQNLDAWNVTDVVVEARKIVRSASVPWADKKKLAVWRGGKTDGGFQSFEPLRRMSKGKRSVVATLSKLWPHLIDAKFSKETADTMPESKQSKGVNLTLYSAGDRIDFTDFFRHKYIIDLPGVGASFRESSLLLGDSVVVSSGPHSFWYSYLFRENNAMQFVRDDLTDLLPQLKALRDDDEAALAMTQRAGALVEHCFSTDVLSQHWAMILRWYAERQDFTTL